MSFTVTKLAKAMVRPSRPTPSRLLELSAIDRLPGLNAKVRTFHVFEHGHEPGKVIREALSKALVYYYPFAGRLVCLADGEVRVDCTGDGVWFIEASANCSIKDIDCPQVPLHGDLLPDPAPGEDPANMIMLMQVTEFECGGFIIGMENSHCISDGLGTAQFLNAVAEFSRGLPSPTTEPVWRPQSIPSPPVRTALTPPSPPPSLHLQRAAIDLSSDDIAAFKATFTAATAQTCSSFEAIAATIWQCRTRTITDQNTDSNHALGPDAELRLVFMANARPLVQPPLPQGFASNCFFPVSVVASAGWLAAAVAAEVVQLIKRAKERLPEEFRRWAEGEGEEDPYLPALGYATLFLSEWSQLGFEKVDYGWGPPAQVVPLTYTDVIPVCIVGAPPAPGKGIRLSTQCVQEEHMEEFMEQMAVAWERVK